jgi:hypothetical protein
MSEGVKGALIGVIGAVIGAVITVIGTTNYTDWIYGPKEGLFSVNLTKISESDVNPSLKSQIKQYPCTLQIKHINGPAVSNITITIISANPLDSLESVKNDEDVKPILSGDKKKLRIDIPTLRKGSLLQFNFVSIGPPSLEKSTTMASGKLIESVEEQPKTPWYQSQTFFIIIAIVIYGTIALLILILLPRMFFTTDLKPKISKRSVKLLAFAIILLDILPIPIPFTNVFSIFMMLLIYFAVAEG